jgi:hypothetical protein
VSMAIGSAYNERDFESLHSGSRSFRASAKTTGVQALVVCGALPCDAVGETWEGESTDSEEGVCVSITVS